MAVGHEYLGQFMGSTFKDWVREHLVPTFFDTINETESGALECMTEGVKLLSFQTDSTAFVKIYVNSATQNCAVPNVSTFVSVHGYLLNGSVVLHYKNQQNKSCGSTVITKTSTGKTLVAITNGIMTNSYSSMSTFYGSMNIACAPDAVTDSVQAITSISTRTGTYNVLTPICYSTVDGKPCVAENLLVTAMSAEQFTVPQVVVSDSDGAEYLQLVYWFVKNGGST